MQTFRSRCALCPAGAALGLAFVLASPLGAQEPPQEILVETKLLADDGVDRNNFGAALAIDGDTLVVAAPEADLDDTDGIDSRGVVYVFLRDGATGQWTPHQQLVPERGHYEGNFLDMTLAIQGDTLVVGAPYATLDRFQEGAVYVFERDETGHWAQSARIVDRSVGFGGHFGTSLMLSGDLLVIGATQDSVDGHGRVGIFERDRGGPDSWGRVTTLYGFNWGNPSSSPDDGGNPRGFGSSVAIAGDLLLIGATRTAVGPNLVSGAAYFFRRSVSGPDRWEYLTRLVAPGADDCVGGLPLYQFYLEATPEEIEAAEACAQDSPFRASSFGGRVAMQGDTVLVSAGSATGEDGSYSVGAVHVFERDPSGDLWPHVATLRASAPSSSAYFGSDLLLAGDTLIVAARGETIDSRQYQGAVYVFERELASASWQTEKLVASDGLSFAYFGEALALDGTTRLIGAKGHEAARGAVYLHEPELPEEPEDPLTPAYPPTGVLVNDSILEDPSGVILGAVEGAALPALPVWIHEVSAPAESLFPGARPIGSYFNIGAVETTRMPNGTPFAVGLPVPGNADTRRLALAALVPGDQLLDGTSAGMVWTPVIGTYDADNALYVAVTAGLAIEGSTVVLIEHPDLAVDQPPTAAAARVSAGTSSNFEVSCYLADCSETLQRTLDQLERAYAEYSKVFSEPHLSRKRWHYCSEQMIWCSLGTSGPFNGISIYKESAVPSPLCDGAPAATNGFWKTINFCIEVKNHALEYFDATVSHELFHAYQYSLNPVWWQYAKHQLQYWVMEATASAAAGSLTSLVSPPGSTLARDWTGKLAVRRIDFSLTVPNDPFDKHNYEAQDFWVYLGQARQLSLGYLKDMIEEGATATDVDGQIALHFNSSLADEYWKWVKNQVMLEDDINFFPDAPGPNPAPLDQPPCQIQPKSVKHDETTMALMLDHTMTINQPGHDSIGVPLLPLQSNVVEITFAGGTTVPVRISANGAGHRYKVYLDQPADVDGAACRNVADGERTISGPLPPGAKAYVLVSNTTHQGSRPSTHEVRVDIFD